MLSVVIPSRNGLGILRRFLPGIEAETIRSGGELIVVDDGSDDGTEEYLRLEHPLVRVIRRVRDKGFGRSVNAGMEASAGDSLMLLNNDTVPEKGSFQALERALNDSEDATAVVVPSIPRPDGTDDSLFRWGVRRGLAVTGQDIPGRPYPSGACALWKRSAWEELGGFDERYSPIYWEDTDLGARMDDAGYEMLLLPGITVRHHHAATMGGSVYTETIRERNRFIFMDARGLRPGSWLLVHMVSAVLRGYSPFIRGYLMYRGRR